MTTGTAPNHLASTREMAAILGISRRTVTRMAIAGEIPVIRVRRKLPRYDPIAVLKALRRETGEGEVGCWDGDQWLMLDEPVNTSNTNAR